MKFGLLGKKLGHSYSKIIHECWGYDYDLIDVAESDLQVVLNDKAYCGYNVTIPYKKAVIPYLDEISVEASAIGAVNTVVKRGGKLIGYNTDYYGFAKMLEEFGISVKGKKVMILGTGGASAMVKHFAENNGASRVYIVSRTGEINYENCYSYLPDVVVNATPVGTYPNLTVLPFELDKAKSVSAVIDLVYNPPKTLLVHQAKGRGIKAVAGTEMLIYQAVKSRELFLGESPSVNDVENARRAVNANRNVVLIGMSGVGKTTIGREIAKKLNRDFYDTDEIITREFGNIDTIFGEKGEAYFRHVEQSVVSRLATLRGAVVATGGGVVTNEENYFPLSANGVIVRLVARPFSCEGRPLATSSEAVSRLLYERENAYRRFADYSVENVEIAKTVNEVIKIYENSCNQRT